MGMTLEVQTKIVVKGDVTISDTEELFLVDFEKAGYRIYPINQEMSWHYDNAVGIGEVIAVTWAVGRSYVTMNVHTGQEKFRKNNLKLVEKRG